MRSFGLSYYPALSHPVPSALPRAPLSQSGAAFELLAKKGLEALKKTEGTHRHLTEDGQMFYR